MPAANFGAVNAPRNSPEEWFRSLPGVSKCLITSVIAYVLLILTGVIGPEDMALVWEPIRYKLELWRFFTSAIFIGLPGFPFLMNFLMLSRQCIDYEKGGYDTGGGGGSADFAWMIVFGLTVFSVLSLTFLNAYFFGFSLVYMIIYVKSRKHPNQLTGFWGITVQSAYFPWLMLAFQLLVGASLFHPLIGIGIGHLYYFLVDVIPDQFGKEIITTPNFLIDFFGYNNTTGVHRFPAPGASAPPRDYQRPGSGHSWGSGRPLGAQ
mmetsp:Transcript_2748/g.3804  ORF Transcript_2748/g.3804 Transcript_2748/m.3804 type:complete len:264 (-) Transcript_2748:28-819(-)